MPALFPPDSAATLDAPERLILLPPDQLLACLPLVPGLRFVDVGCGTGTFFFPVFERLKGEGVFVAVELQEEMLRRFLSRLEAYAEHPRFMRIEAARAKPDRLPLPDSSADLLLLAETYREIERRPQYLAELRRVLSPHGTLCLLEERARLSEREALDELERAGFAWVVSHSGFQAHWCLTARK